MQKFVRDEEDFFVRFLGINEFGYLIAERTRKVRISRFKVSVFRPF